MRSQRVEEQGSGILAVWEARKDVTLVELGLVLAEMGLTASIAGFLAHHSCSTQEVMFPLLLPVIGRSVVRGMCPVDL